MKKEKKTLSYYTEKKIAFALYIVATLGLVYMLIISILGLTDTQPFKMISAFVLGLLLICVVVVMLMNAAFSRDKVDELAKYDMSIVHQKMSDCLLYYVLVCISLFFIISNGFTVNINIGEVLILIVLQPVLYLTVEQGMFLVVHGKETTTDESQGDEVDVP